MSCPPTWAIVPVKSLGDAKQRLASVLPLEARRRLMLVMLHDVLATLRLVDALAATLVVTPDPEVAELAQRHGALVLREARSTCHSAAAIAGFAEARANGVALALTLPADAPLVTPEEIRILLDAAPARSPSPRASPTSPHTLPARGEGWGEGQHKALSQLVSAPHPNPLPTEEWGEGIVGTARVTLVPSRDGDGTNGLLVAPPGSFAPRFGPGSFARHLAQAAADGIACRTLELPGLALDIDEPADLAQLMRRTRGLARYDFLTQHSLLPAGAGR